MSNNYLKKKINSKKIIFIYLLSILPLVLYGIYKNGFLVYNSDLISVIEIFKPLLITLVPIVIALLYNLVTEKKVILNLSDLPWIAISLFIPINISLLIYTPSIIVFYFINQFIFKNINWAIIFNLVLVLGLYLFTSFTYMNLAESSFEYAYNTIDFIFGRSIGGVSSTSLILGMISYLILNITGYYKKRILIVSLSIYTLLILLGSFVLDVDYTNIAGIFIAVAYLGSFNKFTPVNPKKQYIYACILGITTFIASIFIDYYNGVFISIIIVQITFILYNIVLQKKEKSTMNKKELKLKKLLLNNGIYGIDESSR